MTHDNDIEKALILIGRKQLNIKEKSIIIFCIVWDKLSSVDLLHNSLCKIQALLVCALNINLILIKKFNMSTT